MQRPLFKVALFYVAGVLLAALAVPLVTLFAIALALLVSFVFWPRARPVLLCALILMTGWINLARREAVLSPYDLRTLVGGTTNLVTISGTLRETPNHRVHHDKVKNQDYWTSTAQIDVQEIDINMRGYQPAFGCVMASTGGILPDKFFAGRTVEITGVIGPARGPVAEGLFDYRAYLDHQGIYYQLHTDGIDFWGVVSPPARPPLADRFCAWARKTLALGLPVEDQSLQLEWALTLGWKAALTDEVSEPFIRAATYHIFAVDGLRIAIISGIILGVLRAISIPREYRGVLAVPLIWFYAAMTGWPASAIRAIVMIMVVFGGWALKRPSDLINSLFAAAIFILLWEPRQLFQAGFQLSFFVVLCIILILPFFTGIGERILRPNPLLPESLQPRWQKFLRPPARFVIDLFLTSVAAWLGSIPLVVYYFHLVTPLSGPANVLAVPLCGLVLVCNLASLLTAPWIPYVAILFNHAGWFWMECIRTTSQWSADWPGAYFYLPMPGLFTIALYYFLLLGALTGWLFQGKLRTWKMSGVAILAGIWCALCLWERPATHLTVLPLGAGHAIYVQPPGSKDDWLIDCGGETAVETVVKPFLRAQGVNRLDNFVLTHGEAAFSDGAQDILDLFHPRAIYTSPIRFRSPRYSQFEAGLQNTPAAQHLLTLGDRAGPFRVVYPDPAVHLAKGDDNALVLRADINGTRIILFSDLGHAGQNALLNQIADIKDLHADIVVAGVPEGAEPLTEPLLDAIQPRVIILADSESPANRRASDALAERLARRKVPVLLTRDTLSVSIAIRANHWRLHGMDGTTLEGTPSSLP